MTLLQGNTLFQGPSGSLEALLKEPKETITEMAIVCHPHPLYGGTMHNNVVYRIARAFSRSGFATLRFNFRGVGRSQGEYDDGKGEQDDIRAAIEFMVQRYPGRRLWIGGFSFGATVMLPVGCQDSRVYALIAAGLPVSSREIERGRAECNKPKLIVQGSQDQFGTVEAIRHFFDELSEPKHLSLVDNADHFFDGHLDELERLVSGFIDLLIDS